ncbi:hypothetical protein I553_3860 [Mycobacterium xenopi 4042]|uniref:Uncharacterized protein n=1 Tax=Mycobacterium xenopi 4042 TaxID=1299334 RepID=X8AN87_MYCXE|nr:hypothetical protein I553_3860 [Mycobacterium xenopi 4042]
MGSFSRGPEARRAGGELLKWVKMRTGTRGTPRPTADKPRSGGG